MPLKQNPRFSHGELVKIRLDRCGKNNKTCYYAATETERHKISLEEEDVGIYLEQISYHFESPPKVEPVLKIDSDKKFGGFILLPMDIIELDVIMYPEGTILHKVLFGERGVVFVGQHFLKRVKA